MIHLRSSEHKQWTNIPSFYYLSFGRSDENCLHAAHCHQKPCLLLTEFTVISQMTEAILTANRVHCQQSSDRSHTYCWQSSLSTVKWQKPYLLPTECSLPSVKTTWLALELAASYNRQKSQHFSITVASWKLGKCWKPVHQSNTSACFWY